MYPSIYPCSYFMCFVACSSTLTARPAFALYITCTNIGSQCFEEFCGLASDSFWRVRSCSLWRRPGLCKGSGPRIPFKDVGGVNFEILDARPLETHIDGMMLRSCLACACTIFRSSGSSACQCSSVGSDSKCNTEGSLSSEIAIP